MSASQALVKDLEGEVSVTRNGELVNIKVGDALLPGDEIVTGDTGRLSLEFPGVPGQEPAAGLMHANGKITLGEQEGAHGPQMVVMEDTECFEFTTEITELSSVAADTGAAGLFGGLAAAGGGGLLTAGVGAVAAGMFLGGGSDDNNNSSSTSTTGSTGNNTTAESVSKAIDTVNDSPLGIVTKPVTDPIKEGLTAGNTGGTADPAPNHVVDVLKDTATQAQNDPSSIDPASTVQSLVTAVTADVTELASAGGGNPVGTVVDTVVDGINQTPLGEPLSPVTQAVQSVSDSFDLNSLVNVGQDSGLVSTVVDGIADALQPVTSQAEPLQAAVGELQSVAVQVDSALADGLSALEGAFSGADTGAISPEMLANLPTSLADLPGSLSDLPTALSDLPTALSNLPGTFGDLPAAPSSLPDTILAAVGDIPVIGDQIAGAGGDLPLSGDALPIGTLGGGDLAGALEGGAGGLLGTVENLTAQLQSAGGGAEGVTDLASTVNGITSTATAGGTENLLSGLTNTLNGLS